MELNLRNKVVIVTGASRGIGQAIALGFAEEGANLILVALHEERVKLVQEQAEAFGVEALAFRTDVTKSQEAENMVKVAINKFGKVDVLVNNAAKTTYKRFGETGQQIWDEEIDTCLKGTINCSKAVLDQMVKQGSGRIINIVSDAGRIGEVMQPAYSAAKGGIIAFTKVLAKDYGPKGILVNAVSPAATLTERLIEGVAPDFIKSERFLRMYPLRRIATPQDVANMVIFLASDRASYITGQTISVNGGYCML